MDVDDRNSMTVSFVFRLGEEWIDPEGASWTIIGTGGSILLERTITNSVSAIEMARNWAQKEGPYV